MILFCFVCVWVWVRASVEHINNNDIFILCDFDLSHLLVCFIGYSVSYSHLFPVRSLAGWLCVSVWRYPLHIECFVSFRFVIYNFIMLLENLFFHFLVFLSSSSSSFTHATKWVESNRAMMCRGTTVYDANFIQIYRDRETEIGHWGSTGILHTCVYVSEHLPQHTFLLLFVFSLLIPFLSLILSSTFHFLRSLCLAHAPTEVEFTFFIFLGWNKSERRNEKETRVFVSVRVVAVSWRRESECLQVVFIALNFHTDESTHQTHTHIRRLAVMCFL